ncbi:MAG: radical SAM protein [Candidatus Omnitrophica bacterium]|nr:radical SAM protein [Candidatus Omnitrophota bacterium]MDD5774899.1 radical SAM protein [Candidatus Omnitrophota bacterium]
MDIVLLQMPFWGVGCPPLGPALLKSYLNRNDISCRIFDINAHAYAMRGESSLDWWELKNGYYFFQQDSNLMLKYYRDNRALFLSYIDQIIALKPVIVGCSCYNTSLALTKLFLEDLKYYYPQVKCILGGPEVAGFMNNAVSLLAEPYIDAVCVDEGEKALIAYHTSLRRDHPGPIAGLVYKKGKQIINGGMPDVIERLDELPFPDFSDFDMAYYDQPYSLPSYSSRGCVNQCIFCSGRAYMKRFRVRSGKRIAEEMMYLADEFPDADFIRMSDNVSNGNMKELESLCDSLIMSGRTIRWTMDNAVIRKEMTAPLYRKMKDSGCILIGYGLETPSPRILEIIGKNFSKGVDIARVLREGKRSGIFISVNIMHGLPGETEKDAEFLLDFVVKNRGSYDMLNPSLTFCEFYPGSLGYDNPAQYGLDMAKGSLFWESQDRTNTYPIRMKRFEDACRIIKKYRLKTLFPVEELPNKYALLFKYYCVSKEFEKARECYEKISDNQKCAEIRELYGKITNAPSPGPIANAGHVQEPVSRASFEVDFLKASLSNVIDELEKLRIKDLSLSSSWKVKVRRLAYRIAGIDRIERKMNSFYPLLKLFDAKISSLANMVNKAGRNCDK